MIDRASSQVRLRSPVTLTNMKKFEDPSANGGTHTNRSSNGDTNTSNRSSNNKDTNTSNRSSNGGAKSPNGSTAHSNLSHPNAIDSTDSGPKIMYSERL